MTFHLFLFVVSWVEVVTSTKRREELIQAYHSGIVGANTLTAKNMGGHVAGIELGQKWPLHIIGPKCKKILHNTSLHASAVNGKILQSCKKLTKNFTAFPYP